MPKIPYSKIVSDLPSNAPFIGPETIERQQGKKFIVRIGANESAFGISPLAVGAMRDAVSGIPSYCDPEGYERRAALATHHGVKSENIVLGAGIDDLLGLIVRMYMNPGDIVIASEGSYPTFAYHVRGFGGTLKTVPYRHNRNDLVALTDVATKYSPSILYLANPDNPTGSYFGYNSIGDLLDRMPPNCLFVLDEAYIDFVPSDTTLPFDMTDPRIVRLRTFSKAHGMAGARVGYAIGNKDIIRVFDKVRLHFGVNLLAQIGALASLHDSSFIRNVVNAVDQGRLEYQEIAQKNGISTVPSQTNFVAFDFGSSAQANLAMKAFTEKGIFLRKPSAPELDQLIRVTIGKPEDRALFLKIFQAIIDFD